MAEGAADGSVAEFRLPRRGITIAMAIASFGVVVAVLMPRVVTGNGSGSDCAPTCGGGANWPVLLQMLAVLVAMVIAVALIARLRVRLLPEGIERRRLLGPTLVPWPEVVNISVVPAKQRQSAKAVLILRSGRSVDLPLLVRDGSAAVGALFRRTDPEDNEMVRAIRVRIGNPDPLPPPPAPGTTEIFSSDPSSRRGIVIVAVVFLDLLLVAILLIGIGIVLGGFTHHLDPAEVPEGRVYVAYERVDGSLIYGVQCPAPITAAFGDDPLCQSHATGLLTGGLITIAITSSLIAVETVWLVRRRRRRKERDPDRSGPEDPPVPRPPGSSRTPTPTGGFGPIISEAPGLVAPWQPPPEATARPWPVAD